MFLSLPSFFWMVQTRSTNGDAQPKFLKPQKGLQNGTTANSPWLAVFPASVSASRSSRSVAWDCSIPQENDHAFFRTIHGFQLSGTQNHITHISTVITWFYALVLRRKSRLSGSFGLDLISCSRTVAMCTAAVGPWLAAGFPSLTR